MFPFIMTSPVVHQAWDRQDLGSPARDTVALQPSVHMIMTVRTMPVIQLRVGLLESRATWQVLEMLVWPLQSDNAMWQCFSANRHMTDAIRVVAWTVGHMVIMAMRMKLPDCHALLLFFVQAMRGHYRPRLSTRPGTDDDCWRNSTSREAGSAYLIIL